MSASTCCIYFHSLSEPEARIIISKKNPATFKVTSFDFFLNKYFLFIFIIFFIYLFIYQVLRKASWGREDTWHRWLPRNTSWLCGRMKVMVVKSNITLFSVSFSGQSLQMFLYELLVKSVFYLKGSWLQDRFCDRRTGG